MPTTEEKVEVKAKVQLLHRRGRSIEHNRSFASTKEAMDYAKAHKLMIVHTQDERDGTLTLHYLPE